MHGRFTTQFAVGLVMLALTALMPTSTRQHPGRITVQAPSEQTQARTTRPYRTSSHGQSPNTIWRRNRFALTTDPDSSARCR